MVQDHVIEAVTGESLIHGFVTSLPVLLDEETRVVYGKDVTFSMTIGDLTLSHEHGLIDGVSAQGFVVAVLSVHDPASLGLGEHDYRITATTPDGGVVLDQSGILRVTGDPDVSTPGDAVWFDALSPSPLPNLTTVSELPPPEVPQEVQEERLALCMHCPLFDTIEAVCTDCGCYMPHKTGLIDAACPVGKWGTYA